MEQMHGKMNSGWESVMRLTPVPQDTQEVMSGGRGVPSEGSGESQGVRLGLKGSESIFEGVM